MNASRTRKNEGKKRIAEKNSRSTLHSPRPKFLSILLSVDRLGKNVAQEEYIGWIE